MSAPNPVPGMVDYLRALTPEQYAALTRAASRSLPVAEADQAHAVIRDIRRGLRTVAAEGTSVTPLMSPSEIPELVLLSILDVLYRWSNGGMSTCMHSPDPRRPQPVIAAAWKPDIIVCGHCDHLLKLPRGGVADRTCDECGHVGATIHPDLYTFGVLIYLLGRCSDCHVTAVPR